MRKEKFLNMGEILKDESFSKVRTVAEENDVVNKYDEIFPHISEFSKPRYVKNGVLFIQVENSVWRNELNLQRKIMTEKINKFFNKEIIKSIRFK